MNLWRNLTGRLFDLEANILTASSATEVQTRTVKVVRQQVRGQGAATAEQNEHNAWGVVQRELFQVPHGLEHNSTTTVTAAARTLRLQVGQGKAEERELQKEERKLNRMERKLSSLQV